MKKYFMLIVLLFAICAQKSETKAQNNAQQSDQQSQAIFIQSNTQFNNETPKESNAINPNSNLNQEISNDKKVLVSSIFSDWAFLQVIAAFLTFIAATIYTVFAIKQWQQIKKQVTYTRGQLRKMTKQLTEMKGQKEIMSQQFAQMGIQSISMRDQVVQMIDQRNIMQGQADIMEKALQQQNEAFYASNRAYIGIGEIGIETDDENIHTLPDEGRYRICCTIVNKGKTPALNFGHVFRGAFLPVPVPAEALPPPHFQEIPDDRKVSQILPDRPSPIRGDALWISHEEYELVRTFQRLFIVSVKLTFDCLGIREETEISHHIWDADAKLFIARKNFPTAGTTIIKASEDEKANSDIT